jgi:hypothetical protein
MAEFCASEESRAVICTPGEVFLPDHLETFQKHMKTIVKSRKLSVITGTPPAPRMEAVQFLKELSGVESSHVRLERTYIITDMKLSEPDSVFCYYAIHLTNGMYQAYK